jgi:hypothetical protein
VSMSRMQCAGVRPWDAVPWRKTYPCQNLYMISTLSYILIFSFNMRINVAYVQRPRAVRKIMVVRVETRMYIVC